MSTAPPSGPETLALEDRPRRAPSVSRPRKPQDGRLTRIWAWVLLAVLLVVGAVLVLTQTRGTTFSTDEWTWILQRRQWNIHTLLDPHNGHLSLVPLLLYKILFVVVGLRHYWPYLVMVTLGHLVCVTLLFVYLRRRVGDYIALLGAALLLFFGPGWQEFLWPFQVAWLIVIACGIGALLLLDRDDRIGDLGACLLLAVALGSAGPGVAVAAGLVVEVVMTQRRRRWWIVGVPIALYALWWVGFQNAQTSRDSVFHMITFVFHAPAGALAALVGLANANVVTGQGDFLAWGAPLLIVVVGAISWRLVKLQRVPRRVLTLIVAMLVFWITAAIGRAYLPVGPIVLVGTGYESRYLYVSAVLILLLAAELFTFRSLRPIPAVVAGVLVVFPVLANVQALKDGAAFLRSEANQTVAELGALEIGRPIVAPNYVSQGLVFNVVPAGAYFAAIDALGSPVNPAQIPRLPDAQRAAADGQLIAIHRVGLSPAPRPSVASSLPPVVEASHGGVTFRRGSCVAYSPAAFTPSGAVDAIDLRLPAAGLVLSASGAPATIELRRFADQFETLGTLAPGHPQLLRIGPDLSVRRWHVRVISPSGVTACGA